MAVADMGGTGGRNGTDGRGGSDVEGGGGREGREGGGGGKIAVAEDGELKDEEKDGFKNEKDRRKEKDAAASSSLSLIRPPGLCEKAIYAY